MTTKAFVGACMWTLGIGALALGCRGEAGPPGEPGKSCSVESNDEGAVITCEDGTSAAIPAGEPGPAGASALLAQRPATEAECTNGGDHVTYGSDENGDGTLGDDEVDGSLNVCDGANGSDGAPGTNGVDGLSSLLALNDEPPGPNCSGGGKRLDFGLDDDRDGSLEAAEIDGTSYLCGQACALQDSTFQRIDAWVASGGGSVEATAMGHQDLGQGALVVTSTTASAALTQTLGCPVSLAGLAVTMFGKYSTSGSASPTDARFSVAVNGTLLEANAPDVLRSGASDTFVPLTFCIGASLAAQTLNQLRLNATGDTIDPGGQVAYRLDQVELESVSADACPPPGSVVNGNFENGNTGWVANGTLQIEDDGSGTNRALHMEFAPGCVGPSGNITSGRISVPSTAQMAKPAVRLRIRGDLSGTSESLHARIEYGGTATQFASWAAPVPTTFTEQTHCLPAAARGQAGRIVFAIPINCGDGFRDFWADDISIVDEPSCP